MKYREIPFIELLETIIDNRGKTCPVEENGIPLIATNCIKDETLYPVFEKVRYVSQEVYNTWFRGHPEPEDIIFVLKGSPGRVNWVPNPVNFCIAQDMVAIRANKNIVEPKYLFALLKSKIVKQKIENMHVGSLIPHFKKGDFNKLLLPIPDNLEYQRKVGEIYFSFSNKIELNRQINRTLEAMAQALFKSWFVDFDPVHAKMQAKIEADLDTAAQELGISRDILDLFPDRLVESEMGMVPEGWEVSTLGKNFKITMGQSPSGKSYNEEKRGMIFFQGRRDFGEFFPTERVYTTEPKRIADEDDILLSVRAPVGDINIALQECCVGRGLAAIKHKTNSIGYTYCVINNFARIFQGYNTEGTVFGSVNQKTLKELSVLEADEIIKTFSKIMEPMFLQIKTNELKIRSLQKTRDTLLPKLLSGELDVSEIAIGEDK